MARKRKIKLENSVAAAVPLSSMIDVVFLLLIYFIMTQKKVVEDVYLQSDLPSPQSNNSSSSNVERSIIEVNLNDAQEVNGQIIDQVGQDNDWYWDKKIQAAKTQAEVDNYEAQKVVYFGLRTGTDYIPMTESQLEKWLSELHNMNPDALVLIKCDENARHSKLVKVLNLCSKVQITKISVLHSNDTAFRPLSLQELQEKYGKRPDE